jgi:hypothetical protein
MGANPWQEILLYTLEVLERDKVCIKIEIWYAPWYDLGGICVSQFQLQIVC